ncbi:MAG TPA: succinyl-diaminopimelate desuccinylase, partial [Candidatus Anaerobiospirillum pullistercoris]|nr:succinyl-diaminopimelate desuccinylase [Candidatus Anaerobiospirillum pullistercoris]
LLVTSNEEGDAVGGVPFVAEWLKKEKIYPQYCIVGEPSSNEVLGDTIKIGRRGSMTAHITIHGTQGHVAYPNRINNAAHAGARLIAALLETPLDQGTEDFPPTSFNVTNIHSGVGAENIAPGTCEIMCNWRFNPLQTPLKLQKLVEKKLEKLRIYATVRYVINGLPFISERDGTLVQALQEAVTAHTGVQPELNTLGGTSDGRFIAPLGAETIEFGPCNGTIHKVNECVKVDDLEKLSAIYEQVLTRLHL